MASEDKQILAFNRGVVSPIGLARVDIDRIAMSAEEQTNWMPRVLGSMMIRPGLEHIVNLNNGENAEGRIVPFVFGVDDKVLLEFSAGILSFIDPDTGVKLATSENTTSQTTNGPFTSDITGWTDASDTGGNAQWVTGGYAGVSGDGTDFGILRQEVTLGGGESGEDHWVNVRVIDGPLRFKVGSSAGDDDYVAETLLDRGDHELHFVPTTNFWIEFSNEREFLALVTQITMVNTGNITLISPYTTAADMANLRFDQSGDVIYIGCDGQRTQKVERRGTGKSWSIADYLPEDGPFMVQNTSGITLTAGALVGDTTLTASKPVFKQEHADNRALFRLESDGQSVTSAISGADVFTNEIRVFGAETKRIFNIFITGSFTATVTLQFAFDPDGPWTDTAPQYTAPIGTDFNDGQDDSIIYYRIGIKTGDYTSGTATCTLSYAGGSIQGVGRVDDFTSSTSVSVKVLEDFGSTTATADWWEGEWSDRRGWPVAPAIHEGRLWWVGNNKIFGSVSDQYESFDDSVLGDSGTISRTIGFGPIRTINWLMSMGRLVLGTTDNSAQVAAQKGDGNHPLGARSDSRDSPLTPSNFNIKAISSKGFFVDRTKQRLFEMAYNDDERDYESIDLSVFAPDFNTVGIKRIGVQMKPDMRIHCVRDDGTAGVLVYDRLENVICWVTVESDGADGEIEDVAVLPGTVEDQVFYIVKRTINSATQRHIVKWAMESECVGGQINKMADSFRVYDGTATVTPFTTELLHLRNEDVVVWADGQDIGTHTVTDAGGLNLTTAASKVVAGLGYRARFKSAKLGTINGIGLLEFKKIARIGFIAQNMHYQGLLYGPEFTETTSSGSTSGGAWGDAWADAWGDAWGGTSSSTSTATGALQDLPQVRDGAVQAEHTVYSTYHEEDFSFGGNWDTDSRICLQGAAPRPCTLLAIIAEMETVERGRTYRRRAPG